MTTKYGVEGFFVETLDLIGAWAGLLKVHLFSVQVYRSFRNTNRGFLWQICGMFYLERNLVSLTRTCFSAYNGSLCVSYSSPA